MGRTIIETERLLAREWTADDIEGMIALASDPEVTRFLGPWGTDVREHVTGFVDRQMRMQRDWGWCRWALQLKAPPSDDCCGVVGFSGPGCAFAPDIEVGWTLRRELWGAGLATEAGRAVVDYCFSVIGFDRVISCIDPENAASLRVAKKVGFTPLDEIEYHGGVLIRHELVSPLMNPPRDPRFRLSCDGAQMPGL